MEMYRQLPAEHYAVLTQNQGCSIRGSRKCGRVETRLKSKKTYR